MNSKKTKIKSIECTEKERCCGITMDVHRMITDNKQIIQSTLDHRFRTPSGWRKLEKLSVGDKIFIAE